MVIDQCLMMSDAFLKLLVKFVHLFRQRGILFAYLVLAQFRKPVSKYAKLAGQVYGHDAEDIVEAKAGDSNVIQAYCLLKEMAIIFNTFNRIYVKILSKEMRYVSIE